ncbi:MAG: 4Fe-4S binding protein [Limnochordia bacterium]|jgi:ferredoxin-type protein NapH
MKIKPVGNLLQPFILVIWLLSFALALYDFSRFRGLMYLGLIMMLGTMPLALKYGRIYCGWLCPMGAVLDNLIAPFSRGKPVPKFLQSKGARIGSFLIFSGLALLFFFLFPKGAALGWRGVVIGFPLLVMMVMMITAITLGILFRRRAFCAHLCPFGTLETLFSATSSYDLIRDEHCLNCNKCSRVCVLDSKTWRDGKHAGADCIRCLECTFACPVDALTFRAKGDVQDPATPLAS